MEQQRATQCHKSSLAGTNGLAHPNLSRRALVQLAATAGAGVALAQAAQTIPAAHAAEAAEAVEPATSGASYTAGTYTATAEGRRSNVTVQVTFSDSAITEVSYVKHAETGRIADAALNTLAPRIVELQTLNLDTVSGATFTSNAILSAVADCVTRAGGDAAALQAGPTVEFVPSEQELEADFVIIGAGGAGLPVAIEAARNGYSAVVLEKNAFIGGSMLVSDGRLYIPLDCVTTDARQEMTDGLRVLFDHDMAKAKDQGFDQGVLDTIQSEYDSWFDAGNTVVFDSPEWYAVSNAIETGPAAYESTLAFCESNALAGTWFYDELGAELEKPIIGIAGYQYPRSSRVADSACGEGLIDAMDNFIKAEGLDANIRILLNTKASGIVMEDGAAVGVRGACTDGTSYTVRSKGPVVIATGGYGASRELLERLVPSMGFDKLDVIPTVNPSWATGDGIIMAEAVGAQVYGIDDTMLIPFVHPKYRVLDHIICDATNPLVVNKEGVRFMNETDYRTPMAQAVMQQPDQAAFVIASAQNTCITENGRNFSGEIAENLLDFGLVIKADTLEELAEKTDLPFEALSKTIEEYNARVEAGGPDEFGRVYFEANAQITDGPYYASPITWGTLITYDGLLVDETFACVDTDGNPIPGLYALGETNGYGGLYTSGLSVVWTRAMLGME